MFKFSRSLAGRYGIAVAAVAMATALRVPLADLVGTRQTFLTFYFALVVTAWYGGLGPSLLAIALSTAAATWFFLPRFGVVRQVQTTSEFSVISFWVVSSAIVGFSQAHRSVRRRLEREVVDRREAEAKALAGDDQVRLLLDSTGEGIFGLDERGLCTFSNQACARLLGHDGPSSLLGRDMHALIGHTRADGSPCTAVDCPLDRVHHDGGEIHLLDEVFRRRDGTGFPVECRSSPIRRDGRVVGSVVTFTDISQRARADRVISEQVRLARFGRDIGKALSDGGDLRVMLRRCAQLAVDHLDTAFARIWTVDESGETLELQASAGMYTHVDGDHGRIPVGRFKIGMIARTRRPHLTNEVIGDDQVPEQDWAARHGLVAFAGYPLLVDDRLVGVLATFSRHPLSDSAIEMIGGVANEISVGIERKRGQEQLDRQREWFRVTLASIGDAVITTDTEHRITFLNPVAERLTGWPTAEALGRPLEAVFRIINEETRRDVENPAVRALRDGSIIGLANHTILIARDGSERAIDDSAAPIREAGGEMTGAVLVFRDVTEARADQLSRARSEERFRALVAASSQIVWRANPDGTIFVDSPSWREFTGQTLEQWRGQGWLDALHPDDRERTLARWARSLATGATYETEYRLRDTAGNYRWTAARGVAVLDTDGSVREWVGMNNDIHERKQAEQALKLAKEEAERANEAKSQFLAVLSHELRTPLNPILLAASAMLERPAEPEELRPTFQMIRNNVNLQARLIDDLLDVMSIDRGKMPLHWEVVDCHRLLHQAVQICQSEVYGKQIRLVLDVGAPLSLVNADPARLQQVFWNLIKNAVKFTPDQGSIVVRTANEPGEEAGSARLIVQVSDTGIGIEPAILPRIFDPFQQGETTITRKFGGLGLGLAICKGIVEAHGGTLTAASAGVDQGTTFQVALKVLPGTASEGSGEVPAILDAGQESAPSTLKILVVEDEPTTLRLMARLLHRLGHAVTKAGTITEGTAAVQSTEFDLIISDIGLPDGSGLELMRRAVALRGPLPAIALTGFGMEEDIRRSREAGFTAHLTKPIDFIKLEAMIQQVTRRRPSRD